MHRNAELVFAKHATPLIKQGSLILEVGAGPKWNKFSRSGVAWSPIWQAAPTRGWTYRRCDMMNFGQGQPDFVNQPSEYEIEAANNTFDAVLASQVLEHVRKPWRWVPELVRIAKPGGLVVLVAPLTWLPHTRVDCWRVLPAGMRALLEDAGLEVLSAVSENLDKSGANNANCWGGAEVQDTIGIGRKPPR